MLQGFQDAEDSSSVVLGIVVGIFLLLGLIIGTVVILKFIKPKFVRGRSIKMNDTKLAFSNKLHSIHIGSVLVTNQESEKDSNTVVNTDSENTNRAAEPDVGDHEVVKDIGNYETIFINVRGPAIENINSESSVRAGKSDDTDQETAQKEETSDVYGDDRTENDEGVYNVCKAGASVPTDLNIEHSDLYNRLNWPVHSKSSFKEEGRNYGGRTTDQEVEDHDSRQRVEETDAIYTLPIKRSLRGKCEDSQEKDSEN